MRKILPVVFLSSLTLLSCNKKVISTTEIITSQFSQSQSDIINYEYEILAEIMVYWEDVGSLPFEKYFVYFYSRTCAHCARLKNSIIPFILSRDDFYCCESSKEHRFCNNLKTGDFNPQTFCILGYPTIVEIEFGLVSRYITGEDEVFKFLKQNTLYK